MRSRRPLTVLPLLLIVLLSSLAVAAPAPAAGKPSRAERKAEREAIQKLPQKYRDWLQVVDLLITDEEIATFLALDKDYQRDAFIKQFWAVRDPYKSTARNEFRDRWEVNIEQAKALFGGLTDDRAKVLLLNGVPTDRMEVR